MTDPRLHYPEVRALHLLSSTTWPYFCCRGQVDEQQLMRLENTESEHRDEDGKELEYKAMQKIQDVLCCRAAAIPRRAGKHVLSHGPALTSF